MVKIGNQSYYLELNPSINDASIDDFDKLADLFKPENKANLEKQLSELKFDKLSGSLSSNDSENVIAKFYTPVTAEELNTTINIILNNKIVDSTNPKPSFIETTSPESNSVCLIPELDDNGKMIPNKYAGMLFLSWIDPYPNQNKLQLNYVSLDTNYAGKFTPVYGCTARPEYAGFFVLPIQNQATGQVQFVDVTDPNKPVTLNTDQLNGQAGEAMDLSNAQQQLNRYLSADGKYVLADDNDDVGEDNKIISRNFSNQVNKNNIIIQLTHIKKIYTHSDVVSMHGHLFVDGVEDPNFEKIAGELGNYEFNMTYSEDLRTKDVNYDTSFTRDLNNVFSTLDKGISAHASFDNKTGILTITYDPTNYVDSNGKYANYKWTTNPAKQVLVFNFARTLPYAHSNGGDYIDSWIGDIPADVGAIQLNGKNLPFKRENSEPGIEINWYLNQNIQQATLKIVDETNNDQPLANDNASGGSNTTISFANGKSDVQRFLDEGYVFDHAQNDANKTMVDGNGNLITDYDSLQFGKYDNEDSTNQTFTIYLRHGVTAQNQTRTASRTIHYVLDDGKGEPDANKPVMQKDGQNIKDNVQSITYTRTVYIDRVTGKAVNVKYVDNAGQPANPKTGNGHWVVDATNTSEAKWNASGTKFTEVNSPEVKGYTVNPTSVSEEQVTMPSDGNSTEVVYVVYKQTPATYTTTRENKQVTRTINYLDSQTGKEVKNTPAVSQKATLYRYQIKDEKGNVIGYGTLSQDGHTYQLSDAWTLDQNGWKSQTSPDLTALGYKKTPHFIDGKDASVVEAAQPNLVNPSDEIVNVYYDHDTTPAKPTPDKPDHGITWQDVNRTITRYIKYQDTQGKPVNGAPDGKSSTYTQKANFTRTAIVDKVTNKLLGYDINNDGVVDVTPDAGDYAWQLANSQFDAVKSQDPSNVGYDTVNIDEVPSITVSYNTQLKPIIVIYGQNGAFTVQYIDEDDNDAVLHEDDLAGKYGDTVNYTTKDQIKELEDDGYVLDKDGYTPQTTINENNKGKIYKVTFHHGTKNGQVETLIPTETIHFQYSDGTQAAPDVKGNAGDFKFTRTSIVDAVDGHIIKSGDWNAKSYQFKDGQNNVKVIKGYVANTTTYGNKIATPTDLNVEDTIIYRPISQIITVDENGNPIPGTTPVDYVNDPNDPTKVQPNEDSPKVPGGWTISPKQPDGVTPNSTTNTAKVTPVDPTKPTKVVYTPVERGTVTVIFHDTTTNEDIPGYGPKTPLTGVKDSNVTGYSLDSDIQALEKLGYVRDTVAPVPTGDLTAMPAKYTDGLQTVYINLKHGTENVTPDNPDPERGYTRDSLIKQGTQKVIYVGAGDQTPAPSTTNIEFDHSLVIDTVTGKVITDNGWTPTSQTYKVIDTPTVTGYTPDQKSAGGETVTFDPKTGNGDINKTYVVTYTKNPAPVNDQTAIVNYVDSDEHDALIATSGNLTGKPGTKINYSTAQTIQNLEKKGYALVSDGFPAGATYDHDDSTTQTYIVVLKHTTTTVTPDKPGTPGQPVDPNNPDGPKYPTGTDITDLERTGTQTIHYVGAGDKTPADNKQSFDFTKTITFDNVTGKIISDSGWNVSSHTFGRVDTPVVQGYHADKASAGETTITPTDLNKEVTVTYAPNGKIIPVDPNGKPIPDVPTPQYPTDPTDPTKVTPDEPVPTVPGRTPDQTTVTPKDPGKDTDVIYRVPTKDEGVVNVIVQDTTTGRNLPNYGWTSGTHDVGTKVDFNKSTTLKDLENAGYKVINPDVTVPSEIAKGTVNVIIYVEHQIIPVTPDKPGNGLKDTDLTKTVTETVHYVGAGDQTPADKTTQLHFTGTAYYDSVTKKWTDSEGHELKDQTKNITWTANDGHKFAVVVTPAVDGYTSTVQDGYDDGNGNVKEISGIDQNSNDVIVTVTYSKASQPTKPVQPITPNTPNKPAVPGNSLTPANPGTPTSSNTPMNPTVQPVANNTDHVISQPVNVQQQQQAPAAKSNSTLPQTGNNEAVSAAALGLMGLAVAASLGVGATKKRHE